MPGHDAAGRRRRAVVSGHSGDPGRAAGLVDDDDPGVRAAALGALDRLGALTDSVLVAALRDPDATVRRRACVVVGRSIDPDAASSDVMGGLLSALDDPDASVVEAAAWAVGEFGPLCAEEAVSGLCRVASGHDSPLCREAAVASLGAVGAPDTLPVVVAALEDTTNIRRRAAIALAAFDDPVAEEGLRRCLGDRDWQVRQAAEELLADD